VTLTHHRIYESIKTQTVIIKSVSYCSESSAEILCPGASDGKCKQILFSWSCDPQYFSCKCCRGWSFCFSLKEWHYFNEDEYRLECMISAHSWSFCCGFEITVSKVLHYRLIFIQDISRIKGTESNVSGSIVSSDL